MKQPGFNGSRGSHGGLWWVAAIFPRFENGNSGTSKCSNILPSFCHGVFRIGLGCVLWEVSLRVLATLHFANCGVLLFLIVYFKGGCFLFLEKVLGHIYDHLKLALCANLHNFFIMYTHRHIYIYTWKLKNTATSHAMQPALYASPTKESWNLRIVCRWIAFELPSRTGPPKWSAESMYVSKSWLVP